MRVMTPNQCVFFSHIVLISLTLPLILANLFHCFAVVHWQNEEWSMRVHVFPLHGQPQVFEWLSISSLIRSFFLDFPLLTQVWGLDFIFLKCSGHENCIYRSIS